MARAKSIARRHASPSPGARPSQDEEQTRSAVPPEEIVPNERIVSTEVYEGMPDGEALDTLTLTEVDGRTTLTILVQHTSKEHRDAHIESGMEAGMQEVMDLLEQVAISLR